LAESSPHSAALLDLPLEVLVDVCEQFDFCDLICIAATCQRFRYGDRGLATVELPTKSPVVRALLKYACPGGVLVPSTRPIGCSESWVAYLARYVRQRRGREAPPVAAGVLCSLFVHADGRLLSCGDGAAVGRDEAAATYPRPTTVIATAGMRMRSVAAGGSHSLALGWDGRVNSWGSNWRGPLGHGDTRDRPLPALVRGLEGVRNIAAFDRLSLAVTRSGAVFQWGQPYWLVEQHSLSPITVHGFEGVRVRRVFPGFDVVFAIGEEGEVFSWGRRGNYIPGHGETQTQPSPKRVEALQGIRMSSVSFGDCHALALAEDGLVYAWGVNRERAVFGGFHVKKVLLPRPVKALRGVRVGSIAAAGLRSYAVSDTGELWAWGCEAEYVTPLGHGEKRHCCLPKPIESFRGVKVDAVIAPDQYTLALANVGSVYAWGNKDAAAKGALGLGPAVSDAGVRVPTPQRIPELRVACGLW
jgi:alpha-tubulin suppressor-like RCC1 family protein